MLTIVTYGDPILTHRSAAIVDIDEAIRQLAKGMFETMQQARGLGLAAVQVGELVRLFVTNVTRDKPRVFINPELIETSIEQESFEEGCLSIPGVNAEVLRSSAVRVQAWNEKGRPFTISADGLLSRVIQHEIDHVNGVLLIDRIDPMKRERILKAKYGNVSV